MNINSYWTLAKAFRTLTCSLCTFMYRAPTTSLLNLFLIGALALYLELWQRKINHFRLILCLQLESNRPMQKMISDQSMCSANLNFVVRVSIVSRSTSTFGSTMTLHHSRSMSVRTLVDVLIARSWTKFSPSMSKVHATFKQGSKYFSTKHISHRVMHSYALVACVFLDTFVIHIRLCCFF